MTNNDDRKIVKSWQGIADVWLVSVSTAKRWWRMDKNGCPIRRDPGNRPIAYVDELLSYQVNRGKS